MTNLIHCKLVAAGRIVVGQAVQRVQKMRNNVVM